MKIHHFRWLAILMIVAWLFSDIKSVRSIICSSALGGCFHLNFWVNAILAQRQMYGTRVSVCMCVCVCVCTFVPLFRSFGHSPLTLLLFLFPIVQFPSSFDVCRMPIECEQFFFPSCDNVSLPLWMKEKGAPKWDRQWMSERISARTWTRSSACTLLHWTFFERIIVCVCDQANLWKSFARVLHFIFVYENVHTHGITL